MSEMPSKTMLQMQGEVLLSGLVSGQWYDALSVLVRCLPRLRCKWEVRLIHVCSVSGMTCFSSCQSICRCKMRLLHPSKVKFESPHPLCVLIFSQLAASMRHPDGTTITVLRCQRKHVVALANARAKVLAQPLTKAPA